MKLTPRYLLLIVFIAGALTGFSQPPVTAKYSGGHAEFNIYLTLYADSTYLLEHHGGLMIATRSKRTGTYSITDSSITLTKRKRQRFLLFFSWNTKKYIHTTYRIRGDEILMYSEEQEASENGDFIKAYNTLRKD
jgi:hypothetical protein